MVTRQPSATALEGNQVTYVPAGTGPAYQSPIDKITFLITGEQSGGAFFMAEVSVAPGGSAALRPTHMSGAIAVTSISTRA